MIELHSFLKGQWTSGKAKGAVLVNPTTEEVIGSASTDGLDLVGAVAWGRDVGGKALRAMTFAQRGALLQAMSTSLHEIREELIEASIVSGGTTRGDAKFDIDGGIGALAHYARLGTSMGEKRIVVEGTPEPLLRAPRYCGVHVRSPREGIAVHINAFNFPVWGMAEKLACAFLAGVPVISKPATSTALLAYKAAQRLVDKAGIPEGAFQFVAGSAGNLLSALGPQDVLGFTGSADTGATLRTHPAVVAHSVRVNVEADSLNASVLGLDVEVGSDVWHTFIRHLTIEITQKAGQKCTATRRIFVPKALIDDVQAALIEKLAAVRVGDPGKEGSDMGPLATSSQLTDARAGVQKLVDSGARIVHGSTSLPEGAHGKGYFLAPMLLRADAPSTANAVHAHEVFAPVSTLMPYETASEAAQLVARGEGSLVASVYSDDKALLEEVVLGIAPWSGRVVVGSSKIVDQMLSTGAVLPASIHGGPGRAGGGEELGSERGLAFYQQRTAIQGDRQVLERTFGIEKAS